MSTALLLLGAADVAKAGSSGNLTPATLVRYQGTNVSEKSHDRGTQFFKKYESHLQILSFIWVTRRKFQTGNLLILGNTVQKVALDLCIPGKWNPINILQHVTSYNLVKIY
jgi:hypothetical protein